MDAELSRMYFSFVNFLFIFIFRFVMCRAGLVEVLLGILDWRAGGRNGLMSQMKWNENEASVGRVLAVEVCYATPQLPLARFLYI